MSSLLALLSQQTPSLQTRKALILLGLQNDFISTDGKLPVRSLDFVEKLRHIVPAFRDYGDIIWVRSEFQADRAVSGPDEYGDSVIAGSHASKASSDDEELFLTNTRARPPCCIKGSHGAHYPDDIQSIMHSRDMQIVKSHYSAFGSTNLLITLRSKLITELYVGGCLTNMSVYATAMDAARYGIKIYLLEDCLGYRRKERHDLAVKRLRNFMEAETMTSDRLIAHLNSPPVFDDYSDEDEDDSDAEDEDDDNNNNEDGDLDDSLLPQRGSGQRSSSPLRASDGLMAADSDHSEDEMVVPDFGALSMRDANYPRPLSSRSLNLAGDSMSRLSQGSSHRPSSGPERHARRSGDYRPSSSSSSSNSPTQRRKSPTPREQHRFSSQSQHNSFAGRSQTQAYKGNRNVTPSKREFNASDQADSSSKPSSTVFSTAAGTSRSKAQTGGPEEKKRCSPPRSSSITLSRALEKPLFGEDMLLESAGSRILYDLLPAQLAAKIFDEINQEVSWQRMHHQTGEVPRLVCCQGTSDSSGSIPVYRHPSDQTPPLQKWTPAVDRARRAAESIVGHPLNHALIQLYRDGTDYISEHSDKTLDIAPNSFIVNITFGAQRTMRLRTKRPAAASSAGQKQQQQQQQQRTTHRVPMPHNSMIAMSLATNAKYLHGINADKRREAERSEAERAFGGQRISLTFRHITTFLSADERLVWGQGAVAKTQHEARPVVNGDAAASERLVRAFGRENQMSSVTWSELYGEGFDVLHLKAG